MHHPAPKSHGENRPAPVAAMKFPQPKFFSETERIQRASGSPSYESARQRRNSVRKSRYLVTLIRVRRCRKPPASHDQGKVARYRQRLRASGGEEVLFQLPRETIALLDELKERQGLRNRSQALLQLIERGREATQQVTRNAKARLAGRAFAKFVTGLTARSGTTHSPNLVRRRLEGKWKLPFPLEGEVCPSRSNQKEDRDADGKRP